MSVVHIATNFNIDIEFTTPPFYRRFLAWVTDLIIQVFYLIIAMRFLNWLARVFFFRDADSSMKLWAVSLLFFLPFLLYHVIMETTMNGQSIGKKIMGIKVISETGGKPSSSQFIIRWLLRTSDYTILVIVVLIPFAQMLGSRVYWGVAGALGLLLADLILINTNKQQRLGDILAQTVLIDTREAGHLSDTVFLEVPDEYIPQFPQIMQLSDRDMNALKGIIDTAKKHRDHHMAAMAAEKVQRHLKIETEMEAEVFLEVLLKDYNYLSAN